MKNPSDPVVIRLSAEDYDEFVRMLDEPLDPERRARLRELMQTPSIFENSGDEYPPEEPF